MIRKWSEVKLAGGSHCFGGDEGTHDGPAMAIIPANLGIGDDGSGELGVILPCEVE